jgi:hypothetical protein
MILTLVCNQIHSDKSQHSDDSSELRLTDVAGNQWNLSLEKALAPIEVVRSFTELLPTKIAVSEHQVWLRGHPLASAQVLRSIWEGQCA